MKKLNIIYMLLGCLLTFVACSDDDYSPTVSPLKVTESSVAFNAKGGDGEITVASSTPIASVESSDDWCVVSADGDYKVKVTVDVNETVASRNSIVTIKDQGGNETHISVTQSGLLFFLDTHKAVFADAAAKDFVKMVHSNEVALSVNEDVDWLEAVVQGDSIVVNTKSNETGEVRSAYVYCTSGPRKDSVLVVQGESKDILGDYYFAGQDKKGKLIYILGNLAKGKTANTLKLSFPALNASMEVPYDEANMSFKFLCGQYLCDYVEKDEETGDETTSYIYSALWDTKKGGFTWGDSYSMDGIIYGDPEIGTIVEFADNGSWSGYNVSAIRFEMFSKKEAVKANRIGALISFIYPFMQKMKDNNSASRKSNFVPANLSIIKLSNSEESIRSILI